MNAEQLEKWIQENFEELYEGLYCGRLGDLAPAVRVENLRELFDGKVLVPVDALKLTLAAANAGLRRARAKNQLDALVWTNAIADTKAMLATARENE